MSPAGEFGRAERTSAGRRWRLPRLETWVMAAAVAALIVLVVLPLLFLLVGSVRGEAGLSLEHFTEALTGRLYLQALQNSLVLGAWTGLFSLLIGLPMAWAVCRTNVPAPALFRLTASLSYLSPPFLTAIAYVNLFSPNAGLINVLLRDVRGRVLADVQRLLHERPRAGDGAAHLSVRVPAGLQRAAVGRRLLRGGGPDPGRRQAAHRADGDAAAGRARGARRHAAGLRQRHRAVRLAGDPRPAGQDRHPAHAHLRAVRLSAAVRAGLRPVAAVHPDHGRRPLPAAPVSRAPLLRHGRRQGRAVAD